MIVPKKLNAVLMAVKNLKRSLAWYKEHFGFEKIYDVEGGVLIGSKGVEIVLSQVASDVTQVCDPVKEICIRLFAMEVTPNDLEKVRVEFSDDNDIIDLDNPRYKSYIISDPDGHSIELYVDKN